LNWNFVVAQQPGNQPDVKRDGPLPSEQLTDLVKLLPVDENALEFDAPGDRKAKLKSQLDELKPKFEAIVRASDEPLPALRLGKLLKEADLLASEYDRTVKPDDPLIKAKDKELEKVVLAMQPADRDKFRELYTQYIKQSDPNRKAELRKALEAISPEAIKLADERQNLLEPYRTARKKLDALRLEFNQPAIVRYRYARLLLAAGDTDGAKVMFLEAYKKNLDPRLGEFFKKQASAAGVPLHELRTSNEQREFALEEAARLLHDPIKRRDFEAMKPEERQAAFAPVLKEFERARAIADADLKQAELIVGKPYNVVLDELKQNADKHAKLLERRDAFLRSFEKEKPEDFKQLQLADQLGRSGKKEDLERANQIFQRIIKENPELGAIIRDMEQLIKETIVLQTQLQYLEQFIIARFKVDESLTEVLYDIYSTAKDDSGAWFAQAKKVLGTALNDLPETCRAMLNRDINVRALKTSLRLNPPELESVDALIALAREATDAGDFRQARADYEQAIKNADAAYIHPQKIEAEIQERLKILADGKYIDKSGQEVKLGPNDILRLHDEIEEFIQIARAPMQTRCAYALALMEQGRLLDADKVWDDAIVAADRVPVQLIRQVDERLRRDRNAFVYGSEEWKKLRDRSLEDQERARCQIDIRYTAAMFQIAGGKDERGKPLTGAKGAPLGEMFRLADKPPHMPTSQTWDRVTAKPDAVVNRPPNKKGDELYPGQNKKEERERARDALDRTIGDQPFCNADKAFKLLEEAKRKTYELDGIDLNKEPGAASDRFKALWFLTQLNAPEELRKKMETHSSFWKNASSDGAAAIVGLTITVGLLALTKGRSGIGWTALRYSAVPVGAGFSVGTRYGMMLWVHGDDDETLLDSTIHGLGSYGAAGALLLTKKGLSKLCFSAFTEERVGEVAYAALKAQKAARLAPAGEVVILQELAQSGRTTHTAVDLCGVLAKHNCTVPSELRLLALAPEGGTTALTSTQVRKFVSAAAQLSVNSEPTVADLALLMKEKGLALPPKLAEAAKDANAGSTLLTKETAAEYLGASGQQGARLLRRLFKGTELLESDAAALAQTEKVGWKPWAGNRVPVLGMRANGIPGAFGIYSRELPIGFVASSNAQLISTVGSATNDWRRGRTDARGNPITPWSAICARSSFYPYDKDGIFDPYVLLDNMWIQSAAMAPLVGYERPGRPLYQSPFAAYSEARAAGSGRTVASARFAGNLFLHQPYFAVAYTGDALRGAGPSLGLCPPLEPVLQAGWLASSIEINPISNVPKAFSNFTHKSAASDYREMLGKPTKPSNKPYKEETVPDWLPNK
jgi:hypothetical protein